MFRMSHELPVLVLETDEPLRGLLETVLRRDGYSPQFVRDGTSALRLLSRDFAAIIVDISVAPSTLERGARRGIGFIHHLERNRPALLPRVIAVSGLPSRDLPADLPTVIGSVLPKPFDIDALREAIIRCAAAAA